MTTFLGNPVTFTGKQLQVGEILVSAQRKHVDSTKN